MLFRGNQVLLEHVGGIPNSDVVILRVLDQRKREWSFLEERRACIKVRKWNLPDDPYSSGTDHTAKPKVGEVLFPLSPCQRSGHSNYDCPW